MKQIRILGLAFVVAIAVGAVGSAGASANPEFYECAKEAGGKYEKGCGAEGGKGGYTIKPGVGKGKGFKGKGGLLVLQRVVPGKPNLKLECA